MIAPYARLMPLVSLVLVAAFDLVGQNGDTQRVNAHLARAEALTQSG